MITDHMIIKASGQYDKEVIQRLRLEHLGKLGYLFWFVTTANLMPLH